MPRNARSTPSKSNSGWANGLRFVASLFFLYVLFGGSSAGSGWWSPWILSGAGSLWEPILLSAAVLASVALFFGTISSMVWGIQDALGIQADRIGSVCLGGIDCVRQQRLLDNNTRIPARNGRGRTRHAKDVIFSLFLFLFISSTAAAFIYAHKRGLGQGIYYLCIKTIFRNPLR